MRALILLLAGPAAYFQHVTFCGAPSATSGACSAEMKAHLKSLTADATGAAITLTDMRELVKPGSIHFLIEVPDPAGLYSSCRHHGQSDEYWHDVIATFDAQGAFVRLDATIHQRLGAI